MDIIIALIILLIMWIGNAPARQCRREGQENFRRMLARNKNRVKEDAIKKDYWCPDGELHNLDYNFYSDGSLKKDVYTGVKYKKGERYCNSRGFGPANSKYNAPINHTRK